MYRFREMVEMEGGESSNQQFSDMFQKFAIAFKTKTYELFESTADDDVISLLDSAEEIITDQKVVVIKPDPTPDSDPDLTRSLIPSLFAVLSSIEASYLQFQTAHVPKIDQIALETADKSLVLCLQKLTDMRDFYVKKSRGLDCSFDFPAGSFLEYQVQENQSKLKALDTMVNSLQTQIDFKVDEVRVLKEKLKRIGNCNDDLYRKLGVKEERLGTGMEVLLTFRVFEAMLSESVKFLRCFTKLLIDLMKKAGWDLEKAANSVYSGVNYTKKGHFRYAFLSHVCLRMFQDFDKNDYGLHSSEPIKGVIDSEENCYLKQLIEHIACNPMEILIKNPKCKFSRFCEKKYEELIHPTMESSIFRHLDGKYNKVLDSWKSLSVFYESFVRMASSIWLLHKLASSFNPAVEIFQVERGVEFVMVYMEDVVGKRSSIGKSKSRVGFTVVPGFKVGRTVIQSQVYLTGSNHIES